MSILSDSKSPPPALRGPSTAATVTKATTTNNDGKSTMLIVGMRHETRESSTAARFAGGEPCYSLFNSRWVWTRVGASRSFGWLTQLRFLFLFFLDIPAKTSHLVCSTSYLGCDFVGEYTNLQKIIVERFPSDGVFCVFVVFRWFCWLMGHPNAQMRKLHK